HRKLSVRHRMAGISATAARRGERPSFSECRDGTLPVLIARTMAVVNASATKNENAPSHLTPIVRPYRRGHLEAQPCALKRHQRSRDGPGMTMRPLADSTQPPTLEAD